MIRDGYGDRCVRKLFLHVIVFEFPPVRLLQKKAPELPEGLHGLPR